MFTLLTILALASQVPAPQWGDWHPPDADLLCLRVGTTPIGVYRKSNDTYRPWDARTSSYGEPCEPPIPVPGRLPTGVVRERIQPGKVSINGQEVTPKQALAAVEGVPDDATKPHLTVIGAEAECKALLARPEVQPLLSGVRVQSYRPGEWPLAAGFAHQGALTVYLQDAAGKVLWREHDPQALEGLASAIRKADPNYKPDRDPGPNRGGPEDWLADLIGRLFGKAAQSQMAKVPTWVWVAGAVALLVVFAPRRAGNGGAS